jgi:phosphate starvation-inducible protein PhoH and related proteins
VTRPQPEEQRIKISFEDADALRTLCGETNKRLKLIERAVGAQLHVRGNEITIVGGESEVETARGALEQLYGLAVRGRTLSSDDVVRAVKLLQADHGAALDEIFSDTVLVPRVGRPIAPKGLNQKLYVDAVRKHDMVFAVGPAGTGKTYLAMALAVRMLLDREIKRIVLTRPAVEAGERLGFLPGTLEEKINPYLRPLYDALHDMLDYNRVRRLMEQDAIEVAPLAFMRGRAQTLTSLVMTPDGWREIGSLEVGDHVIGSDGQPTQVLGIFPQGAKEVFQVTATDGATTRACGEHLWFVTTPDDHKHGKAGRVLETQDMIGNLRRHHQHRYELPMLSGPVQFAPPPYELPIEPYALGLLLGDGCITGKTTPAFATADRELVASLDAGLGGGVTATYKGCVDYVLSAAGANRWHPNPLTVALRDLSLLGRRSSNKFVPLEYLYNVPAVRLAVLQGLLDTDGGPVVQQGRSCRVQYTTNSDQLRDDVVFLVRSLGGVAYWRCREAEGRAPGRARNRPVHHRSDAYVLDIRLPPGVPPFRLARKAERYAHHGGGRPMRFVESIEPVGVRETVCIQVAAPDSLYLTDDFLLTHNTLSDSFIILDEAQNSTREQMKMFLTRLGFGSKAVVNGDITQSDLPTSTRSGLVEALRILGKAEVPGLAICKFTEQDVVRHPLVQDIIRAYDADEK